MGKFTIFYSWQSDLPANKTKNFIRECIDEAISLAEESEAIEAERDEATKGVTGSPNIVTTLFSKIDECDLFIADLSLCYTENQKQEKKSPNPNVMLELGYAVKTLGWDRIVCLCNTDYGKNYPFDVAHNRITDFSLTGANKAAVKSEISKIIFINIRELRKQGPRAKAGMAAYIVGTYDFEKRTVVPALLPIQISQQEGYILHNCELVEEAKDTFEEILVLTDKIKTANSATDEKPVDSSEQVDSGTKERQFDIAATLLPEALLKKTEVPATYRDTEEDILRIKSWLGLDVPDDFFDLGNLKQVIRPITLNGPVYNGSDDEKKKLNTLHDLSYKLLLLEIRKNYLKTFDGMLFIPLAIQNVSNVSDEEIHVLVNVDKGEIIEPDEHLIWTEYDGLQGRLCKDDDDENDFGIIHELFSLVEDGVIHVEDTPYNPALYMPKIPTITINGLSQPGKTEEDYLLELKEVIATTDGRGYYEFDIQSLRPGECKWFSYGLLIKPVNNQVVIRYQIHSKHSSGNAEQRIELQL